MSKVFLAALAVTWAVGSAAQASETALEEYERRMEPYAQFEIYGSMAAQTCGIRDSFWFDRLMTRLSQSMTTDPDIHRVQSQLSEAQMEQAGKYLREFQSGIYTVVLGRDVRSGCETLRTMPFLRAVDKVVTDY